MKPYTFQDFLALCGRYNVSIASTPNVLNEPKMSRGVFHGGVDTTLRVIYIHQHSMHQPLQGAAPLQAPDVWLHELAHIVMQPPFAKIADVGEDRCLLQFERALARTLPRWIMPRVVNLQETTHSWAMDEALSVVAHYARRSFWQKGYDLCQKLDVLDARRKPTGRLPRWSRLSKAERRYITSDVTED